MNRRAFLKGASALAAVAVAAPVLPAGALLPYQGVLLDEWSWLEQMSQDMVNVVFYGDTAPPLEFTGLPVINGVVTLPHAPAKGMSVMITQLADNEPRPGRVTWGRHTVYGPF